MSGIIAFHVLYAELMTFFISRRADKDQVKVGDLSNFNLNQRINLYS